MSESPYGVRVDLDPALARELGLVERRAAQVHVLRARADGLRGPDSGGRALLLAIRATELEAELLAHLGVDDGADVLRRMADHPATLAAIERWRYAQELARRVLEQGAHGPDGGATGPTDDTVRAGPTDPGSATDTGGSDGAAGSADAAGSGDADRSPGPAGSGDTARDATVIPLRPRSPRG